MTPVPTVQPTRNQRSSRVSPRVSATDTSPVLTDTATVRGVPCQEFKYLSHVSEHYRGKTYFVPGTTTTFRDPSTENLRPLTHTVQWYRTPDGRVTRPSKYGTTYLETDPRPLFQCRRGDTSRKQYYDVERTIYSTFQSFGVPIPPRPR